MSVCKLSRTVKHCLIVRSVATSFASYTTMWSFFFRHKTSLAKKKCKVKSIKIQISQSKIHATFIRNRTPCRLHRLHGSGTHLSTLLLHAVRSQLHTAPLREHSGHAHSLARDPDRSHATGFLFQRTLVGSPIRQ